MRFLYRKIWEFFINEEFFFMQVSLYKAMFDQMYSLTDDKSVSVVALIRSVRVLNGSAFLQDNHPLDIWELVVGFEVEQEIATQTTPSLGAHCKDGELQWHGKWVILWVRLRRWVDGN